MRVQPNSPPSLPKQEQNSSHVWLRCLFALLFCVMACGSSGAEPEPLRAPAVPLVVHDPYFSIWSGGDKLTDVETTHWTGRPHPLRSTILIDGEPLRVMGTQPTNTPALPQQRVTVWPTRTVYRFANQKVTLTFTFMTPALPEDLEVLARPVTYLTWEVSSTDGQPHTVEVEVGIGEQVAVNTPDQPATWERPALDGFTALRVGSLAQSVLARKGDDLRIEWGYAYLAAPATEKAEEAARGTLRLNLGQVGKEPVSRHVLLAYDDLYSILYFGKRLRPYWRRHGTEAGDLLQAAERDYARLVERCRAFDETLMEQLQQLGGAKYAALCALAYRQTFGGNKLAADQNGMPLLFPKENFSNGCISTVDVLYPQAPFFLVFSPALTKAMLVPVLDYAASDKWKYGYAPHDLGTYPWASGQVYRMKGPDGDRMPVEECGNMLIMLAALARVEGSTDFASPYWPLLRKWADYLVDNGLDPENQLCSADMFGHLPHCANLALKAVLAIGGYAQLCEASGKPEEAKRYLAVARDYAAKWQKKAQDEGRTRLAYHLPGTWGMKHNLIWDQVLGLKLFPESVADAEVAWYRQVQKKYGLPVDSRTDTSLIDWAMWSIAPARGLSDFEALVQPLFKYANETPNRVPLSDWFVTTDAKQRHFQARPVVGGIFIRMLADQATWQRWASRSAKSTGRWAPMPVSLPAQEIVPTARTAQVRWQYTLEEPAKDWMQPDFDASAWQVALGGFGTSGTPGALVGTTWNSKTIWLRREFLLPERPLKNPRLLLIYDEDPEVYINGVAAASLKGWTSSYDEAELAPAARAALRPGRNVLAVHASQTSGGQCIDVGLLEDSPTVPKIEGRDK